MFSPVRLSSSLGLAWAYAGQQAAALATWLGLGPLGVRAVLPRDVCRKLDGELKRLETMVRRILFLVAMQTPLPEVRLASPRRTSGTRRASAATPPAPLLFPFPMFRLIDLPPAPPASRLAARVAARARARACAHAQAGAGQGDPAVRPGPHDLLPARSLMNRFAALEEALSDPAAQVARFRRKLARIRADKSLPLPVANEPPAACTGLQNPPVTRELFWTLHDAALSWLPFLDSG
jgi:hypothetical protein